MVNVQGDPAAGKGIIPRSDTERIRDEYDDEEDARRLAFSIRRLHRIFHRDHREYAEST